MPTTKDAIYDFLKSSYVPGLGEVMAKRIVDKFGDKTLDKIKEDVPVFGNVIFPNK